MYFLLHYLQEYGKITLFDDLAILQHNVWTLESVPRFAAEYTAKQHQITTLVCIKEIFNAY